MRTDAQKRADKKYKASEKNKYKSIGTKMHEDNLKKLTEIATASGMTTPKYMARAAYYCALNNIDLTHFEQDFRSKKDEPENLEAVSAAGTRLLTLLLFIVLAYLFNWWFF